jgi:hypothetical protein
MTHLDIWNTSYDQKKSRESNWQFDSRPLKIKNWLGFFVCRWRVTYRWKDLEEGYKFVLNIITIKGLHTKLWAPKSRESQLWEFWNSHCRNPSLVSQPHFEGVWGWHSHSRNGDMGSPLGLPKIQNSIAGVKTPRLEVFFIPLERSWSVDVKNGLAWAIRTSVAQVMCERKADH